MLLDVQLLHTVQDKAATILNNVFLGCLLPLVANKSHKVWAIDGSPSINHCVPNLMLDDVHNIYLLSFSLHVIGVPENIN